MTRAALALATLLGITTATPVDAPLECSLASQPDGRVKVSVRNRSSRMIEGEVYPVLILEPSSTGSESDRNYNSFWAPVDLDTGRPYGANQPRGLALRPGQVLELAVAPDTLLWDRCISSVWPNQLLAESVPNGLYSLLLNMEGPGIGARAVSNRLPVAVNQGTIRLLREEP